MSRYRPPQPRGSKYITQAGWQKLKDELDHLWRVLRPQVTQAVSEAAAQGDRSENAEYIYGKKQLREIDSRVRFLRQRLDGMVIVQQPPSDLSRIFFGAWVTLEDENGSTLQYRIVGPDEFDASKNLISMDAPLAKALFKKTIDDEVTIELANGKKTYFVTGISYHELEMLN
jgi:transcription elongation factor GreB